MNDHSTLIPFSPMAQGLLTGKFRKNENKLSASQKIYFRMQQFDMYNESVKKSNVFQRLFAAPMAVKIDKLEPIFQTMEDIAGNHKASISQVSLNWLLSTDPHVIPIPGAKNLKQAVANMGTLDFELTKDEYNRICRKQEMIFK